LEAEVLGRNPRLLQGPDTSKQASDRIGRALRAWRPVRQEILNYRKDGSAFWSDLQITPVADSQGWYTHWVSVQRNVTAQREAKASLAAALTERDQLIDHVPGALLRRRCEPGGRWFPLPASPSLHDLTGYSPEESIAPGWSIIHTDPAFHVDLDVESETVMREGRLTSEFRFRHKDGRWIWIRAIRRGYAKPDGAREIISIWTDITIEKQLAEQLAHSAKLAQLGEVTTGMAHELNQPLASISLAAENAQRRLAVADPDLAGVQQKLDMIVEQTSRIARLIDHMRVFGRMDAAKTGPVAVAGVVENALDMLESKLKGAGVVVEFNAEPGLAQVLGAAIPLEQVIINLLANACDAYGVAGGKAGGRRGVTIEARGVGERVSITVRDHAGGIPPEILPRIFQPFFTTKAATHGTGLGLSISYGIINDMGGTISAENTANGAIFTIDLPAVPA
jgi:PAS domain S-box-containing protein